MALSLWPKPADGKTSLGKLKALYVVPNGGNPSGTRYSLDRKRFIYRMAQEYNFLIIEDDAYYFLEERVSFWAWCVPSTRNEGFNISYFEAGKSTRMKFTQQFPKPLIRMPFLFSVSVTLNMNAYEKNLLRYSTCVYKCGSKFVCEFYHYFQKLRIV